MGRFLADKGRKLVRLCLATLLLAISACSGLPGLPNLPGQPGTSTPSETTPETSIPAKASPSPTLAASATPGPITLRIWVPPEFDPAGETQAGKLLQNQLNEFSARRSGVHIEVRVKAENGPGGLLDSLTTASAAAPLALPDLVALPRPTLETAALKGLLHPFDGLTVVMDDPDWYEYARQLARVQNSIFGLPFAGDAMLLVYRPTVIPEPPGTWTATFSSKSPMLFPAADPQALFPLAFYQAAGGELRDDQGRPFLNVGKLTTVLNYFMQAEHSGLMPNWITQFQTDEQAWSSFTDGKGDMLLTWSSSYLANLLADTDAAPIPTLDGAPFTQATGWVWALSSPQPDRQMMATQLAEFLTESSFLARWTEAAGFLPTRPSALDAWGNASLQSLLNRVILSAQLLPAEDVLTSLGPPVEQATVDVLKQEADAETAAKAAVDALKNP
jgi:ABC-type glycerol-3-phosphate transport system substrate-binding protein